tara:strand:- start:102 stop:1274 length:1173 start_codon:yes stop_codon:yes gene_type:complete
MAESRESAESDQVDPAMAESRQSAESDEVEAVEKAEAGPAASARLRAAVKHGVPAVAAAVVVNGSVVFVDAAGTVGDQPCTADHTLFVTASISKTFTALACLQAAERGELDLDADVGRYVAVNVRNPAFSDVPITTRQLLRHVSGLRDDESALLVGPWRTEEADCEVALARYVRGRLARPDGVACEPGLWCEDAPAGQASYAYSNLGFALAGWVLESAAGKPLGRLCDEHIFAPLGMACSAFTLEAATRAPGCVVAAPQPPGHHYGVAEYPAAGLRSTAADLAKYLQALTAPPGQCRLLTEASLRQLLPDDFREGLAWWGRDAWYGVRDEAAQVWTHGGFMQGVRTHVHLWPLRRAATVVLTNGEDEEAKDQIARALEGVVRAAAPVISQ